MVFLRDFIKNPHLILSKFVFKDVRYVMLVLFYCTTILLTKHLVKAYEDYTVQSSNFATISSKRRAL